MVAETNDAVEILVGRNAVPGLKLQGVAVGLPKHMSDLLRPLEQHRIEPVIDAACDFKALPEALDHLNSGPFEKLVVELHY